MALYLVKEDAVQGFRTLLGPAEKAQIKEAAGTYVCSIFPPIDRRMGLLSFAPTSFRHEFDLVDTKINSLHGARTRTEVNRHLHLFFPEEQLFVILKPNLTDEQRCNGELRTCCSLLRCSSSGNRASLPQTRLLHSGQEGGETHCRTSG